MQSRMEEEEEERLGNVRVKDMKWFGACECVVLWHTILRSKPRIKK